MAELQTERGRVALLEPGTGVIEDFLDSVNLSLEDLCERLTGGWLFGYLNALRSAGWEPLLFVVSRNGKSRADLRHTPSGTPISLLHKPRSVKRGIVRHYAEFVKFALALSRELRRQGCSVILVHDYESLRFDLCVVLGIILRLPVYATFQGAYPTTRRWEYLIRRITVRAARALIIGAKGEADRVIERYGIGPEKIWRIPNPLDIELWEPTSREMAREALGLPIRALIVICHGRIEIDYKGVDVLLDAWERVGKKNNADAGPVLLLIGSGPDAAILRRQLEVRQLSGVRWIERYELDRPLMRQFLCAADFYVLASRREGFPVAPLEAMACGLPIIGTDIPAMLDILPKGSASGGLIVPREDPTALAEAIQRLLENPDLRRELGQNARRNVEERFSIATVGRQLGEMLSQG